VVEKILFVAALLGFGWYAIRFAEKDHVDGWAMFAFLCGALLFGFAAGNDRAEQGRSDIFSRYCREKADNVYVCDLRYLDANEPQNYGTGRHND
jgi:hypothetical protein